MLALKRALPEVLTLFILMLTKMYAEGATYLFAQRRPRRTYSPELNVMFLIPLPS
jgi:hypothetical protein